MSLAELEVFRKRMLLILGSLFALVGVLFLLGLGGRGWGFVLAPLVVLIAWVLTVGLRAEIAAGLVNALAKAMGLRLSRKGEFSLEGVLTSGLSSSPDGHKAEGLVEGEVNSAPFTSPDGALHRRVKATSDTVSIYQDINFFAVARYRFHLPFSVKGIVRFGPRGSRMGVIEGPSRLEIIAIVFGFLFTNLLIFWGTFPFWMTLFWYAFWAFYIYMFYTTGLKGKKELERVVLESSEFERLYDVYGDQVEARKLLTPRVQQALVRLRKYLGRSVSGWVEGRNMWLLLEEKGRFPVPVLRPVSETLETWKAHYREELFEIFRVAEILKLEEEARRRGAWWEKPPVGQNESSPAPEKENTASDGNGPGQTEDAPTRKYKLFGR